jgi:hypothetical protein
MTVHDTGRAATDRGATLGLHTDEPCACVGEPGEDASRIRAAADTGDDDDQPLVKINIR